MEAKTAPAGAGLDRDEDDRAPRMDAKSLSTTARESRDGTLPREAEPISKTVPILTDNQQESANNEEEHK